MGPRETAGGSYPYFCSLPEQVRGHKEEGLTLQGWDTIFIFLLPVPGKAALAIPREGIGILASPFLQRPVYKGP